jgi:hypothetical protein
MPLITGAGAVIAPPPPVFAPGPVPLDLRFVDPDGFTWGWSDPSQNVFCTACSGLGNPPVLFGILGMPGGGAIPQSILPQVKQMVIGLYAYHDTDQMAFLGIQDQLSRSLSNNRAGIPVPSTLIVSRPDGSARQIQLYCISGPEQADDDNTKSGLMWSTYTLTFQATDPLWSDLEPTVIEFAALPSGAGVPPMPPVILSPATVLGSTTVTNTGDDDAYPIWQIFGPGSPTLTNNTTGRSFGLSSAIASGRCVTIDTRPLLQSAVDDLGADQWSNLVQADPRDLWQLVPGENDLDMDLAGSGTGSKIVMSYTRRWLRA